MQEAIVGGWAQESNFLSAAILKSLRDLNHRFLDLAAARTCDWAACAGGSTLRLAGQVAPLSAAQRAAAAGCPYALFDLRFQDDAHWRSRLRKLGAWRVADESVVDDDTVSFVRLALFYAWHVASSTRMALPRLLLGMNDSTAAAFRRITVNQLPELVATESSNLSARWSDSIAFWSALMGAASRADPAALRRVQLYGLQLAVAARLPLT
jgi:hypothetical protein